MSNSSAIAAAAFVCALALAMAHSVALAQNTMDDFLKPHNRARSQVRLPELVWDKKLEKQARSLAVQCNYRYGATPRGENHYWATGSGEFDAADAVGWWVKYYDRRTGICSPPPGQTCNNYYQVVSASIKMMGCVREVCRSPAGGSSVYYFVCKYN